MGRAVWRGGWKGSQRIPGSFWQGRKYLGSPSGGHLSQCFIEEDLGVLFIYEVQGKSIVSLGPVVLDWTHVPRWAFEAAHSSWGGEERPSS